MKPSEQADALLAELDFKVEQFFVGGSGPMALRDIRPLGDLDIGVTTDYWFQLWHDGRWEVCTPPGHSQHERCDPPYLYREVQGVQVHVFFAWRLRSEQLSADSDYNLIFKHGLERLWRDGFTRAWPCVRLGRLLRMKAAEQRDKDYPDIARIAQAIMDEGVS